MNAGQMTLGQMVKKVSEGAKTQNVVFTANAVADLWTKIVIGKKNLAVTSTLLSNSTKEILCFFIEVLLLSHKAFHKEKVPIPEGYDQNMQYSVLTESVKVSVHNLILLAPTWVPDWTPAIHKHLILTTNNLLGKINWSTPFTNAELVVALMTNFMHYPSSDTNALVKLIAAACLAHAKKSQKEEDGTVNFDYERKLIVFQLSVESPDKIKSEMDDLQVSWLECAGEQK